MVLAAAVVGAAVAAIALVSCGDDQVVTTTRNLERPGPVALVCAVREEGQIRMLPGGECRAPDANTAPRGQLYGLVANTARGDVALFRAGETSGEPLIDLDRASPGFGFVPVGGFPTDMVSTGDGCRAVTANYGSCDLGVIDVPGVLDVAEGQRRRPSSGIVSRIIPRTSAGPLRARPRSLVIVPASVPSDANGVCQRPGAYRAYVTFPSCNLVAEIELATGMIVRAAKITDSGVQYTTTPVCKPECAAPGAAPADGGSDGADAAADAPADAAADAPADTTRDAPADTTRDSGGDTTRDSGGDTTGDSGGDTTRDGQGDGPDAASGDSAAADAASGDSGTDSATPDAGVDAPSVDAASADAPSADAATSDGAASDSSADAPSSDAGAGEGVPAPQTTSPRGPQPWALAIDISTQTLYVSSAGANFITKLSLGADGSFGNSSRITLSGDQAQSTRIRLSPPATALDDRFLYVITRDRSVRVISTKRAAECETNVDIARVPSGGVPISQASCYVVGAASTPPRRTTAAGAGLRFGTRVPSDVAFISSTGSSNVTNDAGVPEPTPLNGIFALIATSDGTIFVIDVQDANYIPGPSGLVSRLHLPHRPRNGVQGTESGQVDAGVQSVSVPDPGGIPVVVSQYLGDNVLPGQGVALRGPGAAVRSEWNLVYEGTLFERFAGQLRIEGDKLVLRDPGANYCTSGVQARREIDGRAVQHGDILLLKGCESDDECGLGQSCRKPVAQRSDFGLCLDLSRTDQLFRECSTFLSRPREFLVRAVDKSSITIDALPLEPQAVILQPSQPAGGCTNNAECDSGFLCALRDRTVTGAPRQSVVKGQCFRPGCNGDADCPDSSCITPLDGSPKRCAPVPLPLETGGTCSKDDDCKPATVGEECDSDRDCATNAECRAPTSDGAKRCLDRGYRCATFAGLKNRCVRPSPCFAELLRYEVLAGRSFLVGGNVTRQVVDRATNQCVIDTTKSPLQQSRLPIGMATYPVLVGPQCKAPVQGLDEPDPNPCFERIQRGYRGFSSTDTEQPNLGDSTAPTTVVRFSNADIAFSLGVSHLAPERTEPSGVDAGVSNVPQMPSRGMTITLNVSGGFTSQVVSGGANAISLPGRMITGPDGRVYIVDSGDRAGNTGTNGQVLRFTADELAFENYLVK